LNLTELAKKKQISCSVVGRNKEKGYEALQTFKPFGLILKVPFQNIVAASTRDLGFVLGHSDKELDEKREMLNATPQELLREGRLQYNEVVVRGKTAYGAVKIEGVFKNPNNATGMTEIEYLRLTRPAIKLLNRLGMDEDNYFELPNQVSKVMDYPIAIKTHDERFSSKEYAGKVCSIEMRKNGRRYVALTAFTPIEFYCQPNGADLRHRMTTDDFKTFMDEIPNLPKGEYMKHKKLIQALPQQYKQFKNTREQSQMEQTFVRRDADGEPLFSLADTLALMRQNKSHKGSNNKFSSKNHSQI
jgi:hypothetical protein